MITDRHKFNTVTICCWFSCLSVVTSMTIAQALAMQQQHQSTAANANQAGQEANGLQDATVRAFSPRVDYNNEWRPVGRGDPLQNDPTYDYSPPALERVRYWADSSDKDSGNKDGSGAGVGVAATDAANRKTNTSKNEILLLGVANEQQQQQQQQQRVRGASPQLLQQQKHSLPVAKNAKGETPLLQPKYTSIRRSYYAHQLPTHLMPPPMQTIAPPQHLMKHQPQPLTNEHRHNMPSGNGYMSTSTMGMSTHSKPYYSTAATSPWTHTSAATMHQHQQQHHTPHHMPASHHTYDSHHQESVNYVSYTRPTTSMQGEYYSPNAIRPSQNALKPMSGPRKPWVHELLQKELIKPLTKPTMPATKYLMGTTKPIYESMAPVGISTTFTPVAFVTSTTTQAPRPYTSSPIYITSARPTTTTTTAATTTTTTTQSPTFSPSRLLIPNTSNLAFRPTVAPMEMTTDSLFSHYNQPEKPLVGPMYLIIEGHSKVKTYGKNELDPHQPKIVPIIPKREPVIRIADPNEKRGTVETFQVKHLHTKTTTTTPLPATTPISRSSSSNTTSTAAAYATTSTVKPKTTTTVRPKSNDSPADEPPIGMQGLLSLLDSSLGNIFQDEPSSSSLLSSSSSPVKLKTPPPATKLSNTRQHDMIYVTTTGTTILKPITTTTTTTTTVKPPLQLPYLDARVSSKADTITSIIETAAAADAEDDDDDESEDATTEPAPRETRQVFDYDQLPESRLKEVADASIEEADADDSVGDLWLRSTYDDGDDDDDDDDINGGAANDEYEDESHQLIKRIDKLVDDAEDDAEFDEMDLEENENEQDNFGMGRTKTT